MNDLILRAVEEYKKYKVKKIEVVLNYYAFDMVKSETIGKLVKDGIVIRTSKKIQPDFIIREYKEEQS